MLMWLFACMLLLSLAVTCWSGQWAALSEGILAGGGDALRLCAGFLGAYALWQGFMEIIERSGLLQGLTRGLRRMLGGLFPELPASSAAWAPMTLNLAANMLGMGNAATPPGLAAMRAMAAEQPHSGRASNAMVSFLVLNASSIQLVPSTVIALRSAAGSQSPADILLPALLATAVSTAAGLLAVRLLERVWP